MDYIYPYLSPLGSLTLASDGEALTGLWFEGQAHFGSTLGPERAERSLPVFTETARWLDRYFDGVEPGFLPPLRLIGTPFRTLVWELLLDIPYGQTASYTALAERAAARLGRERMSARAVGGAVGRNPISLLVPCHRVLGADGSLTGYAGGIERKRQLLSLEGLDRSAFCSRR